LVFVAKVVAKVVARVVAKVVARVVAKVVARVVAKVVAIEYLKGELVLLVYHKSLFYDMTMRADF
jgi:hypothetical protein